MDTLGKRPNLTDFEVSRTGSFVASVFFAGLLLAGVGATLTTILFPNLEKSNFLVRVLSSPPNQEPVSQPVATSEPLPYRVNPLPLRPVQRQLPPPVSAPVAPLLTLDSQIESDFMVQTTDDALETIARIQEEEEQRLREIFEEEERVRKAAEEAALLAQQKAAEEEARRKQEAEARALAAREAEARQAAERAIAAQQAEARRAQEQALAARQAESRRAQDLANTARQAQAQRAAAEAEAQRRVTAQRDAAAKQVASGPTLKKSSSPSYPSSARKQKLQGSVKIAATVTTSGKVSSPRVVASSGHQSLDASALAAAKKFRFDPAKNGLGQPIAHSVTIPISFRLN